MTDPSTGIFAITDLAPFVRSNLCPCCGGTPPLWSPAGIVEAIRIHVEKHGNPPSREDWRLASYERPQIFTVDRVFGTLNNAIMAAGFLPRHSGPSKIWPEPRILAAIHHWAQRHGGKPPSKKDWAKSAPDHPVCETVVATCGGWNVAIEKAGYFTRGKWGHRYMHANSTKLVRVTT